MLTNLCQIIVDFFVKEDIVPEEQREVYQYGVELSVSTLIGLLIVLAAGAFGGRLIESVIFYIVFCLTRAFCGGFHAHSHLLCKLTFTCVITWDNKNNTWAWDLLNDSPCVFKGTVTSGCSAYYALYQWTFNQDEQEVFSKTKRSSNFRLTSTTIPADDYFARVTYSSGSINNGTLTFSKK